MMNRDPYLHASSSCSSIIMPFGLDPYNWDHTQETQPNFDPPLALPLGPTTCNFPFYSPHHLAAAAGYPSSPFMVIKSEDGGGGGGSSSRPIGLNLGHRTYFSSGDAMSIDRLLSARASQHHHHQPPRCQAEGCKADLSGAKHYHRRHKVCEFHSKATVVVAGGIQQRFCQQCSRFHVLSEFDESKRSCRKRLADHNRRRRKPQNNNNAGNNSSSPADKLKPNAAPPRPSRDSNSSKCTAATSTAAAASNGGLDQGNRGEQSKAILIRNGPALSLGGRTQHQHQHQHQHQGLYSNSYNTSAAATASFYNHHHQSLQFGSASSNDASLQSTGNGGAGSGPDQHQQNQTNLLHLGQAMFQVDFM